MIPKRSALNGVACRFDDLPLGPMRLLKSLTLSLALMMATHAYANVDVYSDETIARALQWETKWGRVTNRAIGNYLKRISKSRLSSEAPAARTKTIGEVRNFLADRLSWKVEGQALVHTIVERCDRSVLEAMTASKLGKAYTRKQRQEISSQYRECAIPGFKLAMKRLARKMTSLRGQLDVIFLRNAKRR